MAGTAMTEDAEFRQIYNLGAVTIAANMAGRGTDILLGGNPEVLAAEYGMDIEVARAVCADEREAVLATGGLRVIGTELHESRRIDNQLRGRAGRQGDPGSSQFYLSLEDDLLRLFGGSKVESIAKMMGKAGMEEGVPVRASMVSKSIESAQRQVEGVHFATRKNLLEYDDVMNLQRMAVYAEHGAILDGKDMAERIPVMVADVVGSVVRGNCPVNRAPEAWNARAVGAWAAQMTGREGISVGEIDHDGNPSKVADALADHLYDAYEEKEAQIGKPLMQGLVTRVMMRAIDIRWMAHLGEMERLKTGISLRALGHRDPLVEYKEEAYAAFERLTDSIYEDFLRILLRCKLTVELKVAKPAA